jgi:predicted CopG family antitoxin
MKTLGVTKELRADIRNVSADGESVDDCINRLLDEHIDDMKENISLVSRTNINISDDTYQRLVDAKVYDDEKLTRVLKRLVKLCKVDE